MNRARYQLTYNYKTNEYSVQLICGKRLDRSKITDNVVKLSQYLWVCRDKSKLEAHIETLKEERANNRRINNEGLNINISNNTGSSNV